MKKYFHFYLIIILLFTACLKAKKSPFDFNSPSGFIFGIVVNSQSSQNISISGSITGFTSGSLVLQNNGQNDLTLTAPTTRYSFSGIARGSSYSISVKTNPSGVSCAIENAKGTASANIDNANITCSTLSAKEVYTNNSNWNDYVKNDSSSIFTATNTACTGSETGGYRACIHGGEIRRFDAIGLTSCTGITASDSLGAFNWICRVNSDNSVSVYSTALNKGKYLSDLVDFSTAKFKTNSVTILKDGVTYLESAKEIWWTNDVILNSTAFQTKRIHLFTANPGLIYISIIPKLAILFQPDTIMNLGTSCPGAAMYIEGSNFIWTEGAINPIGANTGYNLNASAFAVVKNLKIQNTNSTCLNAGGTGFYITGTTNSYFEDIRIANTHNTSFNNHGIQLNVGSNQNYFSNLALYNISNNGLLLNSSSNNRFANMVISNSAGASIATSAAAINNSFLNLTIVNSNNDGMQLLTGMNNYFFTNAAFINNGDNGMDISSNANTFQNIAVAANTAANQIILSTSSNNYFTGNLRSTSCNITGGTNPGLGNGCSLGTGVSDFNFSGATTAIAISTNVTFIDKVFTNDSKNTSDTNGLQTFAGITDWLNFDKFFRGWAVEGTFPTSSSRGFTNSGNLRIYDWTLKSTDTVLRNVNPCPDEISLFNSADSNAVIHSFSTGSVTVLRNAIEIIGDGIGDDDGLCETNESCIYTPNIGAYQGHGNLVSASTVTSTTKQCAANSSSSSVPNVTVWKYETNGY